MYPNIPYNGLSWPITQHSGIISEDVVRGLISACLDLNGKPVDVNAINNYLVSHGIVTDNFRSDSMQVDAWRDYQQILSEFGLIYSTKICNRIMLTPVAIAFADGDISYKELITLQLLRYQYPNGHNKCIEKGAEVSYDPKTVDLYIKYKSQEFLVEVKSITPSNFITRLRTAIGQVCLYDYLMHRDKNIGGRLGLAFTASIPKHNWSVPFITNYMNMDLLYMDSNSLSIRTQHELSLELYG